MLALPCQAAGITVSGAASLTNAFTEVKDAFMKKHPDIPVTTNFAASNPLLRQIEEGAPVDVFASADQATMDRAAKGKFIDEATRVDFALNQLVLITPADS
jgi:molybdate transport system substrate-binding protein